MSRLNQSPVPWAAKHLVAFRRVLVLTAVLLGGLAVFSLFLVLSGRVTGPAAVALMLFLGLSTVLALMPIKPRWRRVSLPLSETKAVDVLDAGPFAASAFGPNGTQVARFLNGLESLSPAQWDEIRQRELLEDAWLLRAWRTNKRRDKAMQVLVDTEAASPLNQAMSATRTAIDEILRRAPAETTATPGIPALTVRTASAALVYRHHLPDWVFDALYDPFDRVIPATALGSA